MFIFLFLHVIPDGLDDGEIRWYRLLSDSLCIQKSQWIITINDKINVSYWHTTAKDTLL